MRRGAAYTESNSNPYGASQRQPMSAQRMQQNPVMNNYPGRADAFPGEEERHYAAQKVDEQWQWDRDAQQMSPHLYNDGQGGYASKSSYPTHIPDVNLISNQESRILPKEQDMEIGYEDNAAPPSLEGLEQKFRDDITKLTKEQVDTEDAENARHREKIMEINNQYQEKLAALRARHATRREELLQKEAQARLQQYQLARTESFQNNGAPSNLSQAHHGYAGAPSSVSAEPPRQYAGGQFDTYRNPETFRRGRMQGADSRVPNPGGGRVYNTGSRNY